MEVQKKESLGYVIFEIRGAIDTIQILKKVKKTIEKKVAGGKDHLAIDLHSATYINSALISHFIKWKKQLEEKGKKFCLIEPSDKAMVILELSGIDKVISVYKSEVEFLQKG